jgi:hypothetical protein
MISTPAEDIALTNLMLARLRPVLGVRAEAYVKWYVGGAFNGAGFDCGGRYADVSFFHDDTPRTSAAVAQSYQIGCGYACVNTWEFELPGVPEALRTAEQEFAGLRASTPGVLTQVTRLQVWLIYQSAAATSAADHQRIASAIVSATGGSPAVAGTPYELPPDSDEWNGDVEIVLPAPAPEAEVRGRLARLFTNLGEQSLFGFGAMCPNHDGAHCAEKTLRYAHLTARQF